jgi:predicted transposase/invertase (TIGR01784 family)
MTRNLRAPAEVVLRLDIDARLRRIETETHFLRQYLPDGVARHLDLETLTIAKDTFVSGDQARHYSDLLYEVKLHGRGDGLVYFLFEHKSFHDRFTALQLLRYMAEIWELRRRQRKAATLPLIIPVVVYHGRKRRSPTRLADLVAAPDTQSAAYVPDFDISFQDFSPEADTQLKGSIELRLLCSCLRAKNDPTSVRRVMEIFRLLRDLGDDACALQWVATIYRYMAGTMDIEAEAVQDIAQQTLSTSKRDTVMTLAERLHRKGLMEGKLEGRLEGRQSVLQRQLAKRFGDSVLDIRMQERLRSATPEELDTWAERILDAATIDDIFTDSETD